MAIFAAAAALAGAAISFIGGSQANSARSQAADKQNTFSLETSSTAYQRGMADMRAAGLNPILAYRQGPATAPGGAKQEVQDTMTPAVQAGSSAYATTMQGRVASQSIATAKQAAAQSRAQTRKISEDARLQKMKADDYAKWGPAGQPGATIERITDRAKNFRRKIRTHSQRKANNKKAMKNPAYRRAKKRHPKYQPIPAPTMRGIY